jgi:hypothetical protein
LRRELAGSFMSEGGPIPQGVASPIPKHRLRAGLHALLVVLVSLLVACVLGEVILRIVGYSPAYVNPLHSFHESDPVLGYRGKRDFVRRFARPGICDVVVAHNSEGFRRHEYDHDPAQCTHRIQVFGDSFTWGYGVGQGQCFTDQMNLLLSGYHIANYGVKASGTVL